MARPKPKPEELPIPRSVSFINAILVASDRFVISPQGKKLRIRDRSDLANAALAEYIEKNYPGLIEQVAREIREGIATEGTLLFHAVAEPPGTYGAKVMPDFKAMEKRTDDAAESKRLEQSIRRRPKRRRPKPSRGQ